MFKRNCLLALTIALSLTLLIPGISLPMMTLKADVNQQGLIKQGKQLIKDQKLHPAISHMAVGLLDGIKIDREIKLIDKTRSILGTSLDLWHNGYNLVAILIILFSTIIPLIKILLMSMQLAFKHEGLLVLNSALSKWSMADVFTIGILIAFLTTTAAEKDKSIIIFQTELHQGFYWFVAYCLTSAAASQFLSRHLKSHSETS